MFHRVNRSFDSFLLFSVTENHPEVQAMVLRALEEARDMSTVPVSLYTEALLQHVNKVHQNISNSGKIFPYEYMTCLFEFLIKYSIR